MKDMDGHLQLAERVVRPRKPRLLITHGLSGSGKTVVSGRLVEELGAVRLRSDVERKRLAGLDSTARSASEVAGGLYTRDMSDRTYAHLLDIARSVIECGHSVIVDAAFLERARRERFRRLADELRVSFRIVDVQCGEPELTRRVQQRAGAGRDASEAGAEVLAHQIRTAEPLDDGERERSVVVDTEKQTNLDAVADAVASTP
jgi:predicted kinase